MTIDEVPFFRNGLYMKFSTEQPRMIAKIIANGIAKKVGKLNNL